MPYSAVLRYFNRVLGSSADPKPFQYLRRYSPYHNVKKGTKYPAVFLTAGEKDERVHPLHARKMTALLQAATASDPAEEPILLQVEREAGHGMGAPVTGRVPDPEHADLPERAVPPPPPTPRRSDTMKLSGTSVLQAPRQEVWRALNDPAVLVQGVLDVPLGRALDPQRHVPRHGPAQEDRLLGHVPDRALPRSNIALQQRFPVDRNGGYRG